MAGRHLKEGLEFSPWDVGIFDGLDDRKIDQLMDTLGCTGFVCYFFLCQRAYGSKGYYYPWRYDDAATTAKRIGGGVCARDAEDSVRFCLSIGLFDQGIFDKWGVLTSRGIQQRYVLASARRTCRRVRREYWLLEPEESAGLDFGGQKSLSCDKEEDLCPQKSPHKGKQRKAEERKAEEAASPEEALHRYYRETMGELPGPVAQKGLQRYRERGITEEALCLAMDEAAAASVRSFRYLEGILRRWESSGVRTAEDVLRDREQWKHRKPSAAAPTPAANAKSALPGLAQTRAALARVARQSERKPEGKERGQ